MSRKVVCLDVGGVLLHPDWIRIAAALREQGVDADPASLGAAEARARRALDDAERIRTTTDAARAALYFQMTLEGAGFPLSPERVASVWRAIATVHRGDNLWSRVDPDAPDVLRRLRAAGLRIAVVSNADGSVAALFTKLGLLPLVDAVVDSGAEGVEKPDPAIFRLALQRVGGAPDEALHVGDLYHVDVAGARAAGLEAWLFDPDGLYADADCPRVRSLAEIAERLP